MDQTVSCMATAEVLAGVERLLDVLEPARDALDARTRLELVRVARRLADRMEVLAAQLLAEADAAEASMRATGTPLSSWLGANGTLSRREASSAMHRARELAARPQLRQAAGNGRLGIGQARAIHRVLEQLTPQLSPDQQQQAETAMIELADRLDADQLAKQAGHVLELVAPQTSGDLHEQHLQREAETAHRERSLRLWHDGGSVKFDGSLPRIEGETWITHLNAQMERVRRTAVEEHDPLATTLNPQQRRADALIAMIRSSGRDAARAVEPRIVVTVDFHKLRNEAAGAGVVGDGRPLSAGELRRLCCDAGILPVVLRGPSQILDVGRSTRVIPPAIRTALTLRDKGCAFPGCDTRPEACEAHHIIPWWSGGSTTLPNLVLLCHHHHALVEPARHGTRDQWQVSIAIDGTPEFTPPARCDPQRKPVRHQRFLRASNSDPPAAA